MITRVNKEQQKINNSLKQIADLVKESSDEEVQIELLIREKYSMSQETKLHREKLMGILSDETWNEYCNYIQECIDKVREKEVNE